jgi:membrane-associated protein
MSYPRFLAFNCVGGAAWVLLCVLAGWLLGGMAFVQRHFEMVLIAVVLISIVPMAIEFIKAREESKRAAMSGVGAVSPEQR